MAFLAMLRTIKQALFRPTHTRNHSRRVSREVNAMEDSSQVPASLDASSSASSQVTHASGLPFTQQPGRVHLDAVLNLSNFSSLSGGPVAGSGENRFYVCGPLVFETAITDSVTGLGVSPTSINRETFAY
ncbi:hypothetical protein D9619_012584 [Psilocybe cf. subviscida]|uniref:Uncharacterized protein n=1 Tax=Psilocybe cf. subviscida TaxID=2480587 RepID=A0A8H5B8Z0_9AGAR|nr:hypothetical protein D9619_012584 [Psilocybe cf. subviscida]